MPYQNIPQYVIQTDFSQDEAAGRGGRSTVHTAGLDNEHVNIKSVLNALTNNLGLVQRSDGELFDEIVKPPSLHPDVLALMAGGGASQPRYAPLRLVISGGNVTVGNGIQGDFRIPFNATIQSVGAWVDVAGVGGISVFDINIAGSSIMTSSKINIDANEKSSLDAAIQPVLTTTAYIKDQILTYDVDSVSPTKPKGLVIWLDLLTP